MALNTTSSLSGQYQNYFSKKLLTYAVQALVLDQFGEKTPLPAKSGSKAISMFRFDAPSTSSIETLGTEGTAPTGTRSLTLTKISKDLIQRGQIIKLTDVLNATDLFNSLQQSIKINGQDAALDIDTQTRNTLVGSNVAGTAKENGDGSALDNSDTLTEMYADGGTDYSTFDATTSANTMTASSILDAVTKMKVNRAQPTSGGMYVAATSPQVLSDVMKINEWLNAAQYSNVQELYKGEVGTIYGAKFIMHTNGWSSVYSSSDDDRFAYSVGGSGTLAAGANIRATIFLGEQAYGVPDLSSQSPFSPKVIITDSADKTDPLNQITTAGFKTFWTTLRLNPAYYVVMRSKTNSTA
jgi:N4-gp56 family major capsid protein